MSELTNEAPEQAGRHTHGRRLLHALPAVAAAAAAVVLFARTVHLELAGDDYLLVQLSNAAAHSWRLLLAPLDSFYRPTTTWTLLLDSALWGRAAPSFHAGNVLLRVLSTIVLFAVARRLRLSPLASFAVAAIWACSPFSAEPVIVVGARIDELLWLSWLGLCLGWPGEGEPWSRRRTALVTASTVWAIFSKETWVVTPALVLALELGLRRRTAAQALRPVAAYTALALAYSAVYFVAFPTSKGYFAWSLAPLAKFPHQLAAFLSLEPLVPVQFPFTWRGIAATAIVAVLLVTVLRRRAPAGIAGCALLIAPGVPTALVPYLPTRYTSIPYAGFLLIAAAASQIALSALRPAHRRAGAASFVGLVALVLIDGAIGVRAELDDAASRSSIDRRLLIEAEQAASEFPVGRPVAVVRLEREDLLAEIARSAVGLPKLYYTRSEDAYGLVETASLFEWVMRRRDLRVRRYDDGDVRFAGVHGAVLAHESGRFLWLDRDAPDLGGAARAWRHRGAGVCVIQAEPW